MTPASSKRAPARLQTAAFSLNPSIISANISHNSTHKEAPSHGSQVVKPQSFWLPAFVTGNCINRLPVFTEPECCRAFLKELETIHREWPSKLVAYVLMPDHFHFISNPRDGRIIEFCRDLKSKAAKAIVQPTRRFRFPETEEGHQVWQESFKAKPLWSGWMINQKINYIHANPVKAKLVKSARDYYWSSFRSFFSQGDEPLAVDHDCWWPDDAEKLAKAMKELGWHSYWKRDGDE